MQILSFQRKWRQVNFLGKEFTNNDGALGFMIKADFMIKILLFYDFMIKTMELELNFTICIMWKLFIFNFLSFIYSLSEFHWEEV